MICHQRTFNILKLMQGKFWTRYKISLEFPWVSLKFDHLSTFVDNTSEIYLVLGWKWRISLLLQFHAWINRRNILKAHVWVSHFLVFITTFAWLAKGWIFFFFSSDWCFFESCTLIREDKFNIVRKTETALPLQISFCYLWVWFLSWQSL